MRNKRFIVLLFSILFSAQFSLAQDQEIVADSLTYKEAIELALEKNFSIKIAKNAIDLADNNASYGNAGFLPLIDLNARRATSNQDAEIEFIDGRTINTKGAETRQLNASVDLNWTLFDGTRMFIAYDRLNLAKQIENEAYRSQINSVLSEVSLLFHQVVRLKESLDLLSETIDISKERLRLEETKLAIGTGSELDVYQAKTDLNADSSAWMRQKIQYLDIKNQFARILNLPLNQTYELKDSWKLDVDLQLEDVLSQVRTQNPELARLKLQERDNQLAVKNVKAEYFPELDLNIGYTYNDQESEANQVRFLTTNGFNYNFTARWNLFEGFNHSRRIENARIAQKTNALQVQQTQLQLESLAMSSWQSQVQSKAIFELEKNNFEFAQKSLDISKEKYNQGLISAVEFREAQRSWLNARLRLLNAEFDVKLNQFELMRLSGSFIKL